MTPKEFQAELRSHCDRMGSVSAAAEGIGVSATFLRDILAGKRAPSEKVLDAVGFRKVVVVSYEPIPRAWSPPRREA